MTDTPKPDTSVETVELAQRAAIRAALEAAAREAAFYGYEVTAGRMFADRICQRIRNLSPDDILKRL